MRIRFTEHLTNEEVFRRATFYGTIMQRRLRLAGHILGMPAHYLLKSAMH